MDKLIKIVAFISIAFNILLLYGILDQSVSVDHGRSQIGYLEEELKLLKQLAADLHSIQDKDIIVKMLEAKYSDRIVKYYDDNDVLFVDGVGLVFENNKFVKYISLND